jgi:pilus assembly protein CpaF
MPFALQESKDSIEYNKIKITLLQDILQEIFLHPPDMIDYDRWVTEALQQEKINKKIDQDETTFKQLSKEIHNEFVWLQPFFSLYLDKYISEIQINHYSKIFVIHQGVIKKTDLRFNDNNQVLRLIELLVLSSGRSLDDDHPTVDVHLPDGSRLVGFLPPLSPDGPSLIIRKIIMSGFTPQALIENGIVSESGMHFLQACVSANLNIMITGNRDAGKTTLLQSLASFIPEDDRIISIEETAEIRINHENIVRMETNSDVGTGIKEISSSDILSKALRMHPDRMIIGEIKGDNISDVLNAMNDDHTGFISTIYANSPHDALSRLETFYLMAHPDLPVRIIREQIATAIDLIIHVACLQKKAYKISSILEVSGMEGDRIILTEIFRFEQAGATSKNKVEGILKPSGIRPLFSSQLEAAGFMLGPEIYGTSLGDIYKRRR